MAPISVSLVQADLLIEPCSSRTVHPPTNSDNSSLLQNTHRKDFIHKNATHPLSAVELFGETADGAKAVTLDARSAPIANENLIFVLYYSV